MSTNNRGIGPMDITATQKTLAACSGSFITSLLVTPLDVVRVRLQSQEQSIPTKSSSHIPPSSFQPHKFVSQHINLSPISHISRPLPDLGVTACCRDVFWVPSTNGLCLASPTGSIATSSASTMQNVLEDCVVEQTSKRHISGTWEGLVKIARYEGLTSLYRGLSPTILMSIPANAIYFTGYDALRFSHKSPLSGLDPNTAPLIAGMLARTIAATVISPIELFRTRLQALEVPKYGVEAPPTSAFRQTMGSVKSMVAQSGVSALWRGLTLTLWRDVPFSGVYWWSYEATRVFLIQERAARQHTSAAIDRAHIGDASKSQSDSATFLDSFIAGAISGTIASLITTPFDVAKTRRQVWTKKSNPAHGVTVAENASMPRVIYTIYQNEGLRGLFTGTIPRTLKVAPACAIMISCYEIGKKIALRMNLKSEETRLAAA